MMAYNNNTIKYREVKQVLTEKLQTTLEAASIDIPIFLENIVSDTPNEVNSEYIEFIVQAGGSVKDASGSYNKSGLATCDIYTPIGAGWKRTDDIHEAITDSFEDAQWLDNVLSVTSVTPDIEGKVGSHYRTLVYIAFRYHHKTSN